MRRIREEEEIILKIEKNPRRSIHSICNQMRISHSKVQRILRDESMHPYYYFISVQHLREDDAERRLEFCQWLLLLNNRDNIFCARILFFDESLFTRGII